MFFKHLLLLFVLLLAYQYIPYSEVLPCTISSETILTEENSPYFINCDFLVEGGASLIVKQGVQIFIKEKSTITVNGILNCLGTKDKPIYIGNEKNGSKWYGMYLDSASLKWDNVIFSGAFIRSTGSQINFNYVKMQELSTRYYISFRVDGGNIKFRNSQLFGTGESEGLTIWDSENVIIFNSIITNTTDTIELINCYGGEIIGNYLHDCFDDGIDFNNSHNFLIEGNIIDNMKDTGMSIGSDGQGSSLGNIIKNNYISNCLLAFDAADGSSVVIYDNTFSNNISSIKLFQKNGGWGGASADIRNNIFYNSDQIFDFDEKSSAIVQYNLSNTSLIEGKMNLLADPILMDTNSNNPRIDISSPCRNAGDPALEKDPDGSASDIGADFYDESKSIIITEINYKPFLAYSSGKWIELFNNTNQKINISNYILKFNDSEDVFIFPEDTFIDSNNYLIISQDLQKFKLVFFDVNNVISSSSIDFNYNFNLLKDSFSISLLDNNNNNNNNNKLIDYVSFSNLNSSIFNITELNTKTLELKSIKLNNNILSSWFSESEAGSPAGKDGFYYFNNITNSSEIFIYPNPARSELKIVSFVSEFSDIEIYNQEGILVYSNKTCCLQYQKINLDMLAQGIYFTKVKSESGFLYSKFIKK